MQVALVQLDIEWESPEANFARVEALLAAEPPGEGALVVLPEMFSVGYTMDVAAVHEPEGGPTEAFLARTARRYAATVVGGRVVRGEDGRGRNEAVVVGPDGRVRAVYAKLHPFRYAGEHDHYAPGDRVVTFAWEGLTAAPFVCYDLRFPEVYRAAVRRGAEVLVTIANWPESRVAHWTALLVARAVENQAYVVGVNRVGADPNVAYPGRSLVVDPRGTVLVDAGSSEGVFSAEVDLEALRAYREGFPVLPDMRPDFVPPAD